MAGSRDDFADLIREYQHLMYRIARGMLRSDEDIADAMQDAILAAYQSLRQLREPKYFRTWLIRILLNRCQALMRSRRNIVYLNKMPETAAPASMPDSALQLEEALSTLDWEQRETIVLFYVDDLSLKEIARTLDISEGTVKSRLYRARTKLALYWHSDYEAKGEKP